jgi:hypothetical protein
MEIFPSKNKYLICISTESPYLEIIQGLPQFQHVEGFVVLKLY